jgi:hypothetical protein
MRVLAASSVPGVPSVTTVLTEDDLAKDASIPDLASQIANWGYVDGRQRTFQGQSRHLSLVVSRALVFQHPTGAASFVAFVRKNSGAYFGDATQVQALRADGRSGWMFTPAPCACHMANPAMIGVLEMGPQVIWLQINGPDASPALLLRLLDPNRSVPTT